MGYPSLLGFRAVSARAQALVSNRQVAGFDRIEDTIMDAKTGANVKTGTLSVGDKSWSFPIHQGSIGPDVIDIGKLYAETGMFTYDPGFTSTASCESTMTSM